MTNTVTYTGTTTTKGEVVVVATGPNFSEVAGATIRAFNAGPVNVAEVVRCESGFDPDIVIKVTRNT